MNKVDEQVAKAELTKWLDAQRVSKAMRTKGTLRILREAIMDGTLILNEDLTIKHNLRFPFGVDVKIDSLNYKSRLNVDEVTRAMKGVDRKNGFELLVAYGSALSGKNKGIVRAMDTSDFNIMSVISGFFA